jgi:hypothetical protein
VCAVVHLHRPRTTLAELSWVEPALSSCDFFYVQCFILI